MGRHRKPTDTINMKKVALGASVTLGAAVVPATFAGPASAATDSQWEAVAVPEAGGNWSINYSGDGLSVGGLQFQNPSWQDALAYLRSQGINTTSFPASLYQGMSNVPTKAQQMLAGEALLHLQGHTAWANGNGSGLGSSMFDGGSIPATVATSGLLAGSRFDTGTAPPPATPPPKPTVSPKPSSPASGECEHETHTVRSGDTLYGITKRHTGDASKSNWKGLYETNKAKVGANPDRIFPGQVLSLPWSEPAGDHTHDDTNGPADPAPQKAASGYVSPVSGTVGDSLIVGPGGSMSRSAGGHSGLDITAPSGTPVVSVAAGVVVSMNASGGAYGNHVVVKHADGRYTLYAHLSAITTSLGASVASGQQVGNVGSTGHSTGAHLHFEVRTHPTDFSAGTFLNPLTYLRLHGVTI